MPDAATDPARPVTQPSPADLARFFLMLGTVAFGGPASHIAMMEEQVVRRRRWLTHEEFLDLLGAANLIPGPSSTELAIFIGYRCAGWAGLAIAGLCFILPAFLIVTTIAWTYRRYGTLPPFAGVLYAMKPVVIAIVLQALVGLGRTALKSWWLIAVAIIAVIMSALGVGVIPVLAVGALLGLGPALLGAGAARTPLLIPGFAPAAAGAQTVFGLWPLFLVFLKVGAILFGSGYVLLAFLRADLVQGLHWLTDQQLLDAVAVGQVTPGPVFTTATFVGFVLAGLPGAVVATVAIFLPSFVYVAASGPVIPLLRHSSTARAALGGVTAASLALMAVVGAQLARAAIVDALATGIFALSLVLLLRYRLNSVWLVLGSAALGVGVTLLRGAS